MDAHEPVNILILDDQPEKLLSYEVMLSELGENLIKAGSGWAALEHLRNTDIAVVLMDVNMSESDGFELATLIRQHPCSQQTAIIFISAVHLTDFDRLKGDERGAVDYIAVPIIPDLLRAKVRVFADLYRTTQQLAQLHRALEQRVAERTAALAQANATLEQQVEERTAALHRETAERQRLERDAQRTERFILLGRLAAGVAHEMRNPLGAILLHVDLLEEELRAPSPDSAAQMTAALAEVKTSLGRLEEVVQNYLSLARVATRALTRQDLGGAVQAWAAEWQRLAAPCGVTIALHGLTDLEPVAFHESTLRRAVLNLVQNALEAMPQGGTVTMTVQATATYVEMQVRDTGTGIPADVLPQIFEPLYTTKPGGTGLGLYLVQEIVAAHGGHVQVESQVGQGTTVTLTLPRTAAAAPARAPGAQCFTVSGVREGQRH